MSALVALTAVYVAAAYTLFGPLYIQQTNKEKPTEPKKTKEEPNKIEKDPNKTEEPTEIKDPKEELEKTKEDPKKKLSSPVYSEKVSVQWGG